MTYIFTYHSTRITTSHLHLLGGAPCLNSNSTKRGSLNLVVETKTVRTVISHVFIAPIDEMNK